MMTVSLINDHFLDQETPAEFARRCMQRQYDVSAGFWQQNRRMLKVWRETKQRRLAAGKSLTMAERQQIQECLGKLPYLRSRVQRERRLMEMASARL